MIFKPILCKIFSWLVIQNRLWTADRKNGGGPINLIARYVATLKNWQFTFLLNAK